MAQTPKRLDGTPQRRALPLLLAVIFLGGCIGAPKVVPVTDPEFRLDGDEKALWDRAKKIDESLQRMDILYSDANLQSLVDGIQSRVAAPLGAGGAEIHVHVLKDPIASAFALPNGSIYVSSGLLAVIDNESQLATVLGHESTHFLRRHQFVAQRSAQEARPMEAAIATLLAVSTVGIAANPYVLKAIYSLGDYSREYESEADANAFSALVAAGYDPRQAPRVFYRLQQELDEAGIVEPFLGSHPKLPMRIESYNEQLRERGLEPPQADEPPQPSAAFDEAVADLLLLNAGLDADLGRFRRANAAVERHLSHNPDSAKAYLALGNLRRREAKDAGHQAQAIEAFEHAARLAPRSGEPQRQLGLLYREQGRAAESARALSRYLALEPDAADRPIIEAYLMGGMGGVP